MRLRISTSFLVASVALAGCGEAAPTKPAPAAAPAPASTPAIPIKKAADWCGEHGVPESVCTRCNEELIPQFKGKGDWCDKHTMPKSQCVECDPSLAAKLAAMAPKDADK